ncbi:glycoside hydrolase TIM-barrel-like domain-containing protein [Brevundimonas kwangchunensis]|uniref:Glycoside hydrolase TIM-barrel-like domain-containing protein n=1 Tax=Brevundimonas kwangchunensis TaxID=322163 RepID=A0ABP3RHS7_9CAUL
MAQVILGAVGGAVGGPSGAAIGGLLGRSVDQWAIAGLEPARQRGPRLEALKVQGTAEGAPLACVFGRARVTGQVIWAARFRESRTTRRGGKGGPRTTEYGYLLSFAVALCEGEIDGVGRVWADGQAMDLTGVAMRLHRGGVDQAPDPLIEAVEGEASAYRGVAYVVFEDLPLGPFGNRVPQLAFEVFNRPRGSKPRLEDRLEGVCLIPGAGEFVLATDVVMRREGLTRTAAENLHGGDGRVDLLVSLDQLQAQCPNLKRVSLVIGWFGTDVRAAECRVRPGVERRDKPTEPFAWSVAGLERHEAHLISRAAGSDAPAYGGTPSDGSVRQAVAELKARGLEVTLYPFVFMDAPGYPWRGRVAGRDGAQAGVDVAAMFGAADGWGLRRMALHYAELAAETGADGLLIGSEMRGLTLTRDADGGFPAVEAFRTLAAECRTVVGPGVKLSYAADWSEYAGLRAGDEARFHLDPLWADPAIDYIGIDWYPPLGDWRAGDGGVDGATWAGPDDAGYLAAQVAGGEGFDWFYTSDADRAAQVRTPIVDTAHGEHWLYRVKDLAGWWSHAHHDRIAGVRQAAPTAWMPGMKPIRLTEFGCAAVDRGGNAPNLFQDPKSTENALPPHSTGARDDRMQRRAMEALLNHHAGSAMVEAMDAWCWDARPWPAFPGRADVWADAGAWRTGHWLNGRLGGETRDLIAAILTRGGLEPTAFEVAAVGDGIDGYVIDRPMRTRDALEPLLSALGLTAAERGGCVSISGDEAVPRVLELDALALDDEGVAVKAERVLERQPREARVRFIDGGADYQTGSATARQAGEGGGVDLALSAVCTAATGRAVAERALATAGGERLTVRPGPLELLALEPGDVVAVEGREGDWRVARLDLDETPTAVLEPVVRVAAAGDFGDAVRPPEPPARPGAPFFRMIELPPLIGSEVDGLPLAVVAGDPWRPMTVWAGLAVDALTARGEVAAPATVGTLVEPLGPGLRNRVDGRNSLLVRIEGWSPESRSVTAVLAGANAVAIETAAGWEIVQFRTATLVGGDVWRLSGLLRAQQGTDEAMRVGAPAGALVVVLDAQMPRVELAGGERGLPLIWRVAPMGAPAGGAGVSEVTWAATGVHGRPWSPAHLKMKMRADGGRDLSWITRSRIDGDRWDGEVASSDPMRFRVRVLDGEAVVRSWEIEGASTVYRTDELTADFPDGLPEGARLAVAQWGEGYGWGAEASIALI